MSERAYCAACARGWGSHELACPFRDWKYNPETAVAESPKLTGEIRYPGILGEVQSEGARQIAHPEGDDWPDTIRGLVYVIESFDTRSAEYRKAHVRLAALAIAEVIRIDGRRDANPGQNV